MVFLSSTHFPSGTEIRSVQEWFSPFIFWKNVFSWLERKHHISNWPNYLNLTHQARQLSVYVGGKINFKEKSLSTIHILVFTKWFVRRVVKICLDTLVSLSSYLKNIHYKNIFAISAGMVLLLVIY